MERDKILLVDDDQSITGMLEVALSTKYRVLTENDGLNALETAREFAPDLIILDLLLPGTSGEEIASEIQNDSRLKYTPIIFITGMLIKDEEREIAGHPFIAKTIIFKELFEAIEKNLGN